ncbi:hypothetical protein [Mycobacterium sp. GA-2829]|uniref:hypothetical protein n=1 Tax=Mycobacterium sp. GA-2829 TaxID=1772283 RepID=UPI0007404AA3|nr:hypothetical protein [Mycobacterium sp. GA-2829]KUI27749.1 hypothetical protein AU194_21885 [Mycobacterium sp. GA-2829]
MSKPEYVNLADTLPPDTIVEPADLVGLSLSITTEGHLVGSLLVATKDGWHRYFLGRDNWTDLLEQAAEFSEICNDPAKLSAAITQLKDGQ